MFITFTITSIDKMLNRTLDFDFLGVRFETADPLFVSSGYIITRSSLVYIYNLKKIEYYTYIL